MLNINIGQAFPKLPFNSRIYQLEIDYKSIDTDRSLQWCGSLKKSKSPSPKKHLILNKSPKKIEHDNLYVSNQNQVKGKDQRNQFPQSSSKKMTMNPQIQSLRNHYFPEYSTEYELKNKINALLDLQIRYSNLQGENSRLQNENLYLKQQREELLLKKQDSQRDAAKLIQDLIQYKAQARQLRIRLDSMHNKLKESSEKLDQQMKRLQKWQQTQQTSVMQCYHYVQKANVANQLLQNQISMICDQLKEQKDKYEQKIDQRDQKIANMEKQMIELKSSVSYFQLMESFKQKVNKSQKMLNILDPLRNSESIDMVNVYHLKQTSMRQKISEQQTKLSSLEKRYNELHQITEQLYQTIVRILTQDIRKEITERYLAFQMKGISEITVVRSETSTPLRIEDYLES